MTDEEIADAQKVRKVRALIQELGFSFRIYDRGSLQPVIMAHEFYDVVMNAESCQALIDKLRTYKMKAFK